MNHKIIFFDGVCNFCNASVNFIIERDKNNIFKFCSIQSEKAKELLNLPEKYFSSPDTFILLDENKTYTHSTAALKVAKHLSFPWHLFYIFIIIPPFVRNFFYSLFARHRYKLFGKSDTCRIPTPSEKQKFL